MMTDLIATITSTLQVINTAVICMSLNSLILGLIEEVNEALTNPTDT